MITVVLPRHETIEEFILKKCAKPNYKYGIAKLWVEQQGKHWTDKTDLRAYTIQKNALKLMERKFAKLVKVKQLEELPETKKGGRGAPQKLYRAVGQKKRKHAEIKYKPILPNDILTINRYFHPREKILVGECPPHAVEFMSWFFPKIFALQFDEGEPIRYPENCRHTGQSMVKLIETGKADFEKKLGISAESLYDWVKLSFEQLKRFYEKEKQREQTKRIGKLSKDSFEEGIRDEEKILRWMEEPHYKVHFWTIIIPFAISALGKELKK